MTHADPSNEATFQVCVIGSDLEQTEVPKKLILEELERHRFDESAIFAMKLAMEEALTNAVKHGNCFDSSKPVTVRYAVSDTMAAVIVRDEGCGFVPGEVPDPTAPERLPLPNGRGIMLLRAYMDCVEYRDQGREVYFAKRRS